MNPLFNALGGGQPNILQMVQQIKGDPMRFLAQKFQVPQNIQKDPNAILNHLVASGQIPQSNVNMAYQMAQRLGIK